ncbi:hypothetical protein [Paenibacillus sp. Leaf72]|uniref:hypothetical protein n=1 Tax=Paenibacillus sp. Leaf72 TaxID=1736234 RepID=UPI0006F60665|nr:hypothetical protein [Paenibacillus sp. Leaf72]KQO10757.1 hypothetical protein ASF12_10200 [Paenibacillus sp. Leaf72]
MVLKIVQAAAVCILLLTGCSAAENAPQSDTAASANTASPEAEATQVPEAGSALEPESSAGSSPSETADASANTLADFEPGMDIDWEAAQSELKEQGMAEALHANLEALLKQDQKAFNSTFLDQAHAEPFQFYLSYYQYYFTGIGDVTYFDSGNINVVVKVNLWSEAGFEENSAMTYTFQKNKEGGYKIAVID